MVKGDSESPDEYHVAVDDGTREVAWDFSIGSEPTPGAGVASFAGPPPPSFIIIDFNQY